MHPDYRGAASPCTAPFSLGRLDLDVQHKIERLRELSDQALLAFLQADLDLGFTLINAAKTERERGDAVGAAHATQGALSVTRTVQQFKRRVSAEAKPEIEKRLADLKSLIFAPAF